MLGGQAFLPTYAAVQNYSNVLTDLKKDESFNADDYPIKQSDYSLQVIQIAESTDGELFLYTYQPCQPTQYLVATSVNMSLSESVDGTELYDLTLLSSSGVFCKYLVNGVTVSTDDERYYNVSSIYRTWDTALDGETGTNNTANYKSYSVGKVFVATTENGKTSYTCKPTYIINVIAPYADFLVYISNDTILPPSIKLSYDKMGMIDSHYIAFSTDLPIDRLMSATVKYSYRSATGYYNTIFGFDCGYDVTYSDTSTDYAYPTYLDKVKSDTDIYAFSYSWDRIQTVDDFISNERLTDETKENLQGKQWVIRFLETPRTQTETNILGYKKYTTNFTKVDEVAILRLEFETGGKVYNLGAVSDVVSGDDMPGNVNQSNDFNFFTYIWNCLVKLFTGKADLVETLVAIFVLFVVVALLPILGFIFPTFGRGLLWLLKGVAYVIKYLFIAIWYVISSPFRLIAWLVNRRQGGDDGEQ